MAMATDTTAWFPEQYGSLIDNAIKDQAVAAQVLTPVGCNGTTMSFPILESDPNINWTAEGAEITLSDAGTAELVVTPKAAKGLVKMSNEGNDDSTPELANVVGNGLSRQVINKLDAALFAAGVTAANAPAGLEQFAYTSIDVPGGATTLTNEDRFVEAKFAAIDAGAQLSAFVLATDVARALANVKVASGDERRLLEHDELGNLRIAGLPAFVSRYAANGVAWGIDRSQNYLVIRRGTSVVTDGSAAFTSDSLLVRGVARAAYAVTNAPGVIKIWDATPV